MKKLIPYLALLFGLAVLASALKPSRQASGMDLERFGALPGLTNGRITPFDSIARNSLLIIAGKQTFRDEAKSKRSALEWLMEVCMDPVQADQRRVFRIDNDQVLGLFGQEKKEQKFFSYQELFPYLAAIEKQWRLVNPEAQLRTPYERAILKLTNAINHYQGLQTMLHPPPSIGSVEEEYDIFLSTLRPGVEAFRRREAGEAFDETSLQRFTSLAQRYQRLSESTSVRIIAPVEGDEKSRQDVNWLTPSASLMQSIQSGRIDPVSRAYARLSDAYRANQPERFKATLTKLTELIGERYGPGSGMLRFETSLNRLAPFYSSMVLYVLVFILASVSWLCWPQTMSRAALWLLLLALVVHTYGLCARMLIQGRPPVTNLYSSAIFIGWFSVLLSIVLERLFRNGIGSAVAAIIGFSTLLIAHHLGGTGETMEMMRAVLDSNFWLATHVVAITIGYAATFLAGFLALIYLLRGMLTGGFSRADADALNRMVYGIICFALLFSFVGTVLGGIWADQSWGRFWGWDPKENGALMIVIWNAIYLHARWGSLAHARGLMLIAVGGNIITSWSWFGTNMLGVGLHSYGFMDSAFFWLVLFWLSQLAVIATALLLPQRLWRSAGSFVRVSTHRVAPSPPQDLDRTS